MLPPQLPNLKAADVCSISNVTTPSGPASSIPCCQEPEEAPAARNPKGKGKGRSQGPMCPTDSNTARNLYTIDYLKDKTATWEDLDKTTHKMYKQCEVEAKKAAKAG
ncbi:hypothetical protein V8E53_002109 [Lactarius tabidus]